jgi:hypothetical protein
MTLPASSLTAAASPPDQWGWCGNRLVRGSSTFDADPWASSNPSSISPPLSLSSRNLFQSPSLILIGRRLWRKSTRPSCSKTLETLFRAPVTQMLSPTSGYSNTNSRLTGHSRGTRSTGFFVGLRNVSASIMIRLSALLLSSRRFTSSDLLLSHGIG